VVFCKKNSLVVWADTALRDSC